MVSVKPLYVKPLELEIQEMRVQSIFFSLPLLWSKFMLKLRKLGKGLKKIQKKGRVLKLCT